MTAISWSKNNKIAYSHGYEPGIYIFCLGVGHLPHVKGMTPCWAPESDKLVYKGRSNLLLTHNPNSQSKVLDNQGGRDPSWSPDGKSIAYAFDNPETPKSIIKLYDLSSNSSRTLFSGDFPCWSPSGDRLAFVDRGLNILDMSNKNITDINLDEYEYMGEYRVPGGFSQLSWSPKGNELMYVRFGVRHLYIVNLENKTIRRAGKVTAWSANWSPDGENIIFIGNESRDDTKKESLFIMDSDGNHLEKKIQFEL